MRPRAAKAGAPERGYRVLSAEEYFTAAGLDGLGERFAVSDLALRRARERARAERHDVVVLDAGRVRWVVRPDGAVDYCGVTRPGT